MSYGILLNVSKTEQGIIHSKIDTPLGCTKPYLKKKQKNYFEKKQKN